MPIVDAFLGYFEREGALFNSEYLGSASCRVYANFPPEDSPNHGSFGLFVDCILEGVAWDHCDNVALSIEGSDLDEKVTIDALVGWGRSPSEEFRVFPEPVELNEWSLTQIGEKLPYMFKKLRELIHDNPAGIPIILDEDGVWGLARVGLYFYENN